MTKPRFDIAKQVRALGADSLLPLPKVRPLTPFQYEAFEDLVDRVSSQNNGTRVIARLEMRRFVDKHGKDRCDLAYERMTGRKKR